MLSSYVCWAHPGQEQTIEADDPERAALAYFREHVQGDEAHIAVMGEQLTWIFPVAQREGRIEVRYETRICCTRCGHDQDSTWLCPNCYQFKP